MGFFSKLFKGPEIDMEKSNANAKKMRALFNQVVENGDNYRLIFGYTEDVSRFNYGFVHGSKTKIGNLIVGWNEASQTIVVVPTVAHGKFHIGKIACKGANQLTGFLGGKEAETLTAQFLNICNTLVCRVVICASIGVVIGDQLHNILQKDIGNPYHRNFN